MSAPHENLAPVYAVEVTSPNGAVRYVPRSDARLTKTAPKLWVKRRDAERAMLYGNGAWSAASKARVVAFRLVPVENAK